MWLLLTVYMQEHWIGGWLTEDGHEYTAFDGLRDRLKSNFELIDTQEMPLLVRETEYSFQWSVAHATVWRRR